MREGCDISADQGGARGASPKGSQSARDGRHAKPRARTRVFSTAACALVFLVGLGLLLYPWLSNAWNSWRQANLVSSYDAAVQQMPTDDYASWFSAADVYNKTLVGQGIPDAFAFHSEDEDADYAAQLAFRDDGMMGHINIPRISQNLPIYHTTSEEVLAKGVGHLQGSALPVGGEGTHCVLSAHRGLPSAALFTDLNQLAVGDKFFIHVLDRSLAYEVDQISVVEPSQTESLEIEKGCDLVTLVTCTPYGVNSHRLLVRGHRVPYDAADENAATAQSSPSLFTSYWLWVACGLAVVAIVVGALAVLERKKRAKNRAREFSLAAQAELERRRAQRGDAPENRRGKGR